MLSDDNCYKNLWDATFKEREMDKGHGGRRPAVAWKVSGRSSWWDPLHDLVFNMSITSVI